MTIDESELVISDPSGVDSKKDNDNRRIGTSYFRFVW